MNHLLDPLSSSASFEEENELIKRFLVTLEAEISQSQLSPSAFQDIEPYDFPQILETLFQNLYVRENYINILISIINHIFDRDFGLFLEKIRAQENLQQELERTREILEITKKKAQDLESAYEREEKAKNELYEEIGSLESNSNQMSEVLSIAKVEIEDYKRILGYHNELDETLKRTKEALKRSQTENQRLREAEGLLERNVSNLKAELETVKQRQKESQESHNLLSQENTRLRVAHRSLSQDYQSIVSENEKINEKNNELLLRLSTMQNRAEADKTMPDMPELEESEDSHSQGSERNLAKPGCKKTSIDRNLQQNRTQHRRISKTENHIQTVIKELNPTQEDVTSHNQLAKQQAQAPEMARHERADSLFTEIIQLKKNEIIDETIFEEGFEKINRLNNEMKGWAKVSEIDIGATSDGASMQKPLVIESSLAEPEKDMRRLFKSRQMIQFPNEERKERKRTFEKTEDPYEEFFILVDMKPFYKDVIDAKIPFNLWYRWLERKLIEIHSERKKQKKKQRNSLYKRFKNCFFLKE